jgi:hypothetical protein
MTVEHASHVASRIFEALAVPALVAVLSVASACGGGGGTSPSNPSPTAPTTTTTNPSAAATITVGSSIDPTHGSCPEIDVSGTLSAGASVVVGPFSKVTSCHYHDHNNPTNQSFQGTLRVGTDDAPTGPAYVR